ncbi:hypothetical protein CW304_13335 [Bacillus sp. UFRGS-B20]|nr:hypothetical protein CW304_13335 [Bacillus sp. UFRGS-B20]
MPSVYFSDGDNTREPRKDIKENVNKCQQQHSQVVIVDSSRSKQFYRGVKNTLIVLLLVLVNFLDWQGWDVVDCSDNVGKIKTSCQTAQENHLRVNSSSMLTFPLLNSLMVSGNEQESPLSSFIW